MKEFNPMQYLAIDIANQYGLNKENFETRIQWVKNNINCLEEYTDEAEEPLLYYKAVKALRDAQAGKPIVYNVFNRLSGIKILRKLYYCL